MVSGPSGASSHRTSSSPFQNASCISTSKAVDGDGASGPARSYVKPGRTSTYPLLTNRQQVPHNLRLHIKRILLRQVDDKAGDVGFCRRASWLALLARVVLPRRQPALPGQQRRWRHGEDFGPAPAPYKPRQRGEPGIASRSGPVRRGAGPIPASCMIYRGGRDRVAEPDEFALHPPVPPRGILRRDADHELADRGCRGRPSGTPAADVVPLACDQPPVPGEQGRPGSP